MGIERFLHRFAARVFVAVVAVVAVVGVVLFVSGVANATSLQSTHQATGAIDPTATKTVLTTSPDSPVVEGTPVTLTATVTPPVPGKVQFKDGDKNLKDPVPITVSSDGKAGKAQGQLLYLTPGPHQFSAVFNPEDTKAYTTSTSQLPFTVTAKPPVDTRIALATTATSPIMQGNPVTLIATVTPPEAPGTVRFKDGTMDLGSAVPVKDGTASESTLIPNTGQRQLVAEFTPTEPAKFNSSRSTPLSLTVLESPQTVTPQAQASGQSLDGPTTTNLDDHGVTLLDVGGLTDGRGVTVLDSGNAGSGNGLTLLDLGGRNDVTLLGGGGVTVLRDHSSEGLLSALLHALL